MIYRGAPWAKPFSKMLPEHFNEHIINCICTFVDTEKNKRGLTALCLFLSKWFLFFLHSEVGCAGSLYYFVIIYHLWATSSHAGKAIYGFDFPTGNHITFLTVHNTSECMWFLCSVLCNSWLNLFVEETEVWILKVFFFFTLLTLQKDKPVCSTENPFISRFLF